MSGLTDLQLKVRKTGVTASELGAILGISPFAGPLEVWQDKVGLPRDFKVTPEMQLGTILEEHIAKRYVTQNHPGATLIHASEIEGYGLATLATHLGDGTFRSGEFPSLMVTPDYLVDLGGGDIRMLELKAVSRYSGAKNFSPPSSKKAYYPPYYGVQVQAQLGTLGVERGMLVPLIHRAKLPPEQVEWLYEAWRSPDRREHFNWWAEWYVSQQELRAYPIVLDLDEYSRLGSAAQEFYNRWVLTRTQNPEWRPVVRPGVNTEKKSAEAFQRAAEGGWGESPEEW